MVKSKTFIRAISSGMAVMLITGACLLAGCTGPQKQDSKPVVQENKQKDIMSDFNELLQTNPKPDQIIVYMDKNIAEASKPDVDKMLQELEKAQLEYLPSLESEYYNGDTIQESLSKIFKPDLDLSKIDQVQDVELRKLLQKTGELGYRVETAEGMYFPIMNYGYLKKYRPYASEDMQSYIDIMSVETGKVPAKDGALVISWNEVVERAFAQESFICRYQSSAKLEAVKELNKKYLTFILFGLNNTPIFSYDTKTMDPEAKEVYLKASTENGDSELAKLIGKYMEMLEKSNYKLTDEIDKFRKEAVGMNQQ